MFLLLLPWETTLRKHWYDLSENVLPVFSFGVLECLVFKSLSHLEFILGHGVRMCSNFIDLHATVELSQHYLLKRVTFFHLIFLPKERKDILTSAIYR